jgi:4-aminobutyrate aminotransferase-like enzyme
MERTTHGKALIKTDIPGPKSLHYFENEQSYLAPGVQTIATLSKIVVERGEGATLEDIDGNRFIDFFAGAGGQSPCRKLYDQAPGRIDQAPV